MRKFSFFIFFLTPFFFSGALLAETQFFKYQKYSIPFKLTPNVYYIDDVGDSRRDLRDTRGNPITLDANGVLELPILIGWRNLGYYNIVGVGADGHENTTFNYDAEFIEELLELMEDDEHAKIDVFTGDNLRDSIIEKAHEFGSPNNRLVIVIGGPRDIVNKAIEHATNIDKPIDDLIRVIGIELCSEDGANCPNGRNVDVPISDSIGRDNHDIVPCYRDRTPSCRAFYVSGSAFPYVGDRDPWYRTHYHQSKIGQYFKNNRVSGDGDGQTFDEYLVEREGQLLKIGDFTALAHLIWSDGDVSDSIIWSTEFQTRMYDELEAGLDTLPK